MPFAENDFVAIERYFLNLFEGIRTFKFVNLGYAANKMPVREPLRPLYLFDFTNDSSERLRIPTDPTTAADSPGSIVHVPISQCRGHFWQSFAATGWRFMRAQIRQLIESKKQLEINETILSRYCSGFAPRTFSDAGEWLGINSSMGLMGKQNTKRYSSIDPSNTNLQIEIKDKDITNLGKVIPDSDAYACDPRNEQMIIDELTRLAKLYQVIQKTGYQPHLNLDGYIRGKYIFDGHDWVFVVTAGSHRMAVMAELGYEWITARIQPNGVKVIDLSNLNIIPVISSGLMKNEELHNFYMPYFNETSTEFPRRLSMR
jgi:hypothetical protein